MRRKALVTVGTATAAAAVWFVAPWQTGKSGSLFDDIGPPEACACAAAVSPPQQAWKICSVRALDAVGHLDDIEIGPDGDWKTSDTDKDPVRLSAAIKEAERKCGTFDEAYGKASELQKRRLAAGYEEYEVVESPEALFDNWSVKNLRSEAGIPSKRHGNN